MIERRVLLARLRLDADLPVRRRDRWAVRWWPRVRSAAADRFMREALEVWERWRLDGLRPPTSVERELLAAFAAYWSKVKRQAVRDIELSDDPELSDQLEDAILDGLARTWVESAVTDPEKADPEKAERAFSAYIEGHELRRRASEEP